MSETRTPVGAVTCSAARATPGIFFWDEKHLDLTKQHLDCVQWLLLQQSLDLHPLHEYPEMNVGFGLRMLMGTNGRSCV